MIEPITILYGENCFDCEDETDDRIIKCEADISVIERERLKYEVGQVEIFVFDYDTGDFETDIISTKRIISYKYTTEKGATRVVDCTNTFLHCWDQRISQKVLCKDRTQPKTTLVHENRGDTRKNTKRRPTKYE